MVQLTPEQDKWLEEVFKPSMHLTLRKEVLFNYYEAEKLLTGATKHQTRGCSCELGGLKQKVTDLYNRYEAHKQKKNISGSDGNLDNTN